MATAIVKTATCPVKGTLIAELADAHNRMTQFSKQEAAAIFRGDEDGARAVQRQLNSARDKRERAIAELEWHVAEHGC
jgi:hypothetical protein